MFNSKKNNPTINDLERAERLREIIEDLSEINKSIPIIVEGKKDAIALRKLGISGEIITLHNGKNLYEFCMEITERYDKVVILLDWDKKGENLNKIVSENLKGYWEEHSLFRELFKLLCQKEIHDIEGLPSLLRRLEGIENDW
jgi:5S rRNA maturation endonuclease (ribonuclease M5)